MRGLQSESALPPVWQWSASVPLPEDESAMLMEDDAESALPPNAADMTDQQLEAFFREQWNLPEESPDLRDPLQGRVVMRVSDQDEDDYTMDEWDMLVTIRGMCRTAVKKNAPLSAQRRAVQWLFVCGTPAPKTGWTFHQLCSALRTRHWVVQSFIQHLWFRRVMVMNPLPWAADLLPEALQSEAIMCAWESGGIVMSKIWANPGGLVEDFRRDSALTSQKFDQAMQTLVQEGLVGINADRAWVSSRGAKFLRPGQRVSWSKSFPGD